MEPVEARHKKQAFDIHDIIPGEYTDLDSITHILFCKDVTSWIGNLEISKPEPLKRFPKAIIDDLSRWPINVVMEDTADRRSEARYLVSAPAQIKVGLLRKHDAMVEDLSAKGMKLTLTHPSEVKLDKYVKVSITSLNLKSQKYQIVKYNPDSGILHLCLPHLRTRTPITDSLRHSYSALMGHGNFQPTLMAYENLTTNGIEIIQDKNLRKAISELYSFKYHAIVEDRRTVIRRNQVSQSAQIQNKLRISKAYESAEPIDLEALRDDVVFQNMLATNIFLLEWVINRYEKGKEQILEVQKKIQSEIEKA